MPQKANAGHGKMKIRLKFLMDASPRKILPARALFFCDISKILCQIFQIPLCLPRSPDSRSNVSPLIVTVTHQLIADHTIFP